MIYFFKKNEYFFKKPQVYSKIRVSLQRNIATVW